jgi:hypothetical protein
MLKYPQTFNRYSYCTNNPLKYTDPSGNDQVITTIGEDTYEIRDGAGNLLGKASGIDDLAQKMKDYESVSRGIDLPLGKGAADYLNKTNGQPNIMGASVGAGALEWFNDLPVPLKAVVIAAAVEGLPYLILGLSVGAMLSTPSDSSLQEIRAPGMPTENDGYYKPQKWNGEKVRNPNGPGAGFPDKDGDVWIPTDHGGTHAPHWDVEHPGSGGKNGGHRDVYPKPK